MASASCSTLALYDANGRIQYAQSCPPIDRREEAKAEATKLLRERGAKVALLRFFDLTPDWYGTNTAKIIETVTIE